MYTLRFPFKLPPGQEIEVNGEDIELGGLKFSLGRDSKFYVLEVEGFPSERAAKHYINNIWAGLMWLLLQRKLSPDAELEVQKVIYVEDLSITPEQAAKNLSEKYGLQYKGPIDGSINEHKPAVYPTGKNFEICGVGQPTVVITNKAEDILKIVAEGASFRNSEKFVEDKKLRVALELYGAYFTEFTSKAKFLTLVMAIEALAAGVRKTRLVIDLIERWKAELDKLSETVDAKSDDALSLEALRRELLIRKDDSIRRRIQSLVITTLRDNGDKDAEEMAKNAAKMYDFRSTLLHEGWLEPEILSKALTQTSKIVERILLALFAKKAG
jgi:hypothetical protein